MEKYRKLPTEQSCPKEDWFEAEFPSGRTFNCIGRRVVELSHVERHNSQGQVKNLSRALGTSKENFQAIANSIKVKGVLLTAQLPFLTVDNPTKSLEILFANTVEPVVKLKLADTA